MSNIERKKWDELSFASHEIIRIVDDVIEEGGLPTVIFVDATVEDIADAVKHIIDTGWLGYHNFYARKMILNCTNEKQKCIAISMDEDFSTRIDNPTHCAIDENAPLIIGETYCYRESKNSLCPIYNGSVFIKLDDGTLLSKQEYLENKPKQNIKKD